MAHDAFTPEQAMALRRYGFVVLHALPHDSTRVEGHEPRLMAYYRVTRPGRPERQETVYPDAPCDPFIEWTGLHNAMH